MNIREAVLSQYNQIKGYKEALENRLDEVRRKVAERREQIENQERMIKDFHSNSRTIGTVLMPVSSSKKTYTDSNIADCFVIRTSCSGNRFLVTRAENLNVYRSLYTQPDSAAFDESVSKNEIEASARVGLDQTSMIITDLLPSELNPAVFHMTTEDPGNVEFEDIGGLKKQLIALREVVELPLINPTIFEKVGVTPSKGVLLYGPPGTGKTLLARAIANNINARFIKASASSLMQKYIGESSKVVRQLFEHARAVAPCVVFIDEVDAIGGKRTADATSADREVHRTLIELLNQLDGFDALGNVKIMMATNRPDMLDSALLRPGRLDRKIEIPLPNEESRAEIFKIYLSRMSYGNQENPQDRELLLDSIISVSQGFNGADLKNLATEAGYYAIRDERDFAINEDFIRAARKIADAKSLEKQIIYEKA